MNKIFGKKFLIGALIVFSIVTMGFVAEKEFKLAKSLDIFFSLFRELNMFYVDETDPEKLVNDAIESMLKELDPYTNFIPESDADEFKFQTTGQYGGIGALIRRLGDSVIISEPYEGFPADKAGLKAGDVIVSIDNIPLLERDISKVSERLKGTPGTKVIVEYRRMGMKTSQKAEVVRQKITIPSVPYYGVIGDSTGYILLNSFTTESGNEVKSAFLDLKNKHHIKSLILDLRGNPGGLLNEAVNVCNLFVNKNLTIVETKGKIKQYNVDYKTTLNPIDTAIPLLVMVNRSSASASEIVAGSLQDLDRAVIMGQRTFGKGLVQTTRPLSYNTQLKVTIAKYYIPSGRCIQALDYSHRNEDGSVGKIPDSLISEFKTKKGRSVYDGGGIEPDIQTTGTPLSNISLSLINKNIFFDFATYYNQKYSKIAAISEFRITDSIYTEFLNYIKDKEFDYKTNSEEQLEKLIDISKKEKYFNDSEVLMEQLKAKLSHDKNKDLETFRNEISELLKEELTGRYYYQKGRIQSSLSDDPEVKKAIELLNDSMQYTNILNGTSGDLAKNKGKYKKYKSL